MEACNLCGEMRWQTLEEVGGTRIVRCSCGLVFLWPQPPKSSLKQAYDEAYYRPWEDQVHLRETIWRKRMDRFAALGPPGRLLDVGCGTGTFLRLAKRVGWEVAGTELSRAGAEAARAQELTVREGEIWEAGFPTASFDVVTCWHVIEHVGDPRQVVQEIHRVLRPGGWLMMATPNLEDRIFRAAYRLARGRRPQLYEPGEREIHLFFFSAATLRHLVTSAGFTDVTIGFDRGAAAQGGKRLVNKIGYLWFRLTGINWGMALDLIARKPPGADPAGVPAKGRAMILAVDCREFVPGRVTGIGRFLRGLLEEIARSRPHLTTVVLVGPEAPIPVAAPHIRVHRLPQRPTLYWDQVLLPRALREVQATVFFSPYYKAPLSAPCPTVVTIHDLIPLQFPAYTRGAWRLYATALRSWAWLLARRAAAVITDSEHSKLDLVSVLGLPPERVHAIPIGVGEEFRSGPAPEAVASAVARYGISGQYLLTIGNFLPHKNLPRLVAAYSALPQAQRDRIRLVLAGTPGGHGPARPVDRATLARPGVLLPGFIAPDDLPLLYAGATALVCPSLAEGFGLPVLEAMACGTPVVCARAGALPEVAGDAALYVDPADIRSIGAGLEKILEDEPLRRELASRGLARAHRFEARKTTGRLVDLLEEIASAR